MTKRTAQYSIGSILMIILVTVVVVEISHHVKFGDFIGYGLHADVLQRTGDIGVPGVNTLYAVRVFNYSLLPVTFTGVNFPGGYLGAGFRCRYQLQKWSVQDHGWATVIDFRPTEVAQEPLSRKIVYPLRSLNPVAWEATGGRNTLLQGDSVRFAIFRDVNATSPTVYTEAFSVKRDTMPAASASMPGL